MFQAVAYSVPQVLGAVILTNFAASKQVSIPIGFEMLAIIVSSACGALEARENKLDCVGSVSLGVICSLGGGILRDVILQVGDVYVLNQPLALPISIITALVVFVFPRPLQKLDRLIDILDIFAVGLFAITGADKAIAYDFSPVIAVMMGFFTGVGGGIIRDMCLAKVPHIFKSGNLYAIAAIAGAVVYVLLVDTFDVYNVAAAVIGVATTMVVRGLSLRFDIRSPTEVNLEPVWSSIRAKFGHNKKGEQAADAEVVETAESVENPQLASQVEDAEAGESTKNPNQADDLGDGGCAGAAEQADEAGQAGESGQAGEADPGTESEPETEAKSE